MEKDIKEILLNYYFYPIGNDHTIVIAGAQAIKMDIERMTWIPKPRRGLKACT